MKRFVRDQDGATAIEYALIISLVGAVIVGALGTIGTALTGVFTAVGAPF
jgi:pilus assembly protein Flp/PilA